MAELAQKNVQGSDHNKKCLLEQNNNKWSNTHVKNTYNWQGVPGDLGWRELKDPGSIEKGTDFYHLGRGLRFGLSQKMFDTKSSGFFMQNFPILWMLAINSNWLWFLPEFSWVGLLKKKM